MIFFISLTFLQKGEVVRNTSKKVLLFSAIALIPSAAFSMKREPELPRVVNIAETLKAENKIEFESFLEALKINPEKYFEYYGETIFHSLILLNFDCLNPKKEAEIVEKNSKEQLLERLEKVLEVFSKVMLTNPSKYQSLDSSTKSKFENPLHGLANRVTNVAQKRYFIDIEVVKKTIDFFKNKELLEVFLEQRNKNGKTPLIIAAENTIELYTTRQNNRPREFEPIIKELVNSLLIIFLTSSENSLKLFDPKNPWHIEIIKKLTQVIEKYDGKTETVELLQKIIPQYN